MPTGPHAPIPTQDEIVFAQDDVRQDMDLYFATQAISRIQRDLVAQKRHIVGIVARWMFAYEFIQQLEDKIMMGEPLERQRRFFDATIPVLIGLGRHLLIRLDEADVDLKACLGYSQADVQATVELLEDIDRSAHREWTPEQKTGLDQLLGCGIAK